MFFVQLSALQRHYMCTLHRLYWCFHLCLPCKRSCCTCVCDAGYKHTHPSFPHLCSFPFCVLLLSHDCLSHWWDLQPPPSPCPSHLVWHTWNCSGALIESTMPLRFCHAPPIHLSSRNCLAACTASTTLEATSAAQLTQVYIPKFHSIAAICRGGSA